MNKVTALILTLPIVLVITISEIWNALESRYYEGFLPPAYGNASLLRQSSFSAGFGPGGYDAVLAFFSLSNDVALSVVDEGANWLERAETSVDLRRAKQATPWANTPIDQAVFTWASPQSCMADYGHWQTDVRDGHSCPGVASYFGGYGFNGELTISDTEAVNDVLFSEGAFILKRRVGYLIVAPQRQLVIFMHAG